MGSERSTCAICFFGHEARLWKPRTCPRDQEESFEGVCFWIKPLGLEALHRDGSPTPKTKVDGNPHRSQLLRLGTSAQSYHDRRMKMERLSTRPSPCPSKPAENTCTAENRDNITIQLPFSPVSRLIRTHQLHQPLQFRRVSAQPFLPIPSIHRDSASICKLRNPHTRRWPQARIQYAPRDPGLASVWNIRPRLEWSKFSRFATSIQSHRRFTSHTDDQ